MKTQLIAIDRVRISILATTDRGFYDYVATDHGLPIYLSHKVETVTPSLINSIIGVCYVECCLFFMKLLHHHHQRGQFLVLHKYRDF